jgi:hypothetical protein
MNRPISFAATTVLCLVGLAACSSDAADPVVTAAPATTASAVTTAPAATTASAVTTAPAATVSVDSTSVVGTTSTFTAEVWADNWFSLYVNGELVGEDSVPITTERSFNAEMFTFEAAYPLTIAMVTKDFKETDSGLEYIGEPNQQMGDGGFIAQFTDTATGEVVAVTGADWRGLVVHRAPLNTDCAGSTDPDTDCQFEMIAEPDGWTAPGFDDSTWQTATVYTPEEVGAKDGYDTISWDSSAALIWGSDLKVDNTVLWRTVIPVR